MVCARSERILHLHQRSFLRLKLQSDSASQREANHLVFVLRPLATVRTTRDGDHPLPASNSPSATDGLQAARANRTQISCHSAAVENIPVSAAPTFSAPRNRVRLNSARFLGSRLCNLPGGGLLDDLGRSRLDGCTIDQQALDRGSALLQRLRKPRRALATA